MSETGMAMMGSGHASGEDRARVAAEMAVSSPLLEDVNLSGARGILVNVTAGMDLGIGEFEEVGNIVKEFASEDATVVVGTVIDPNLSNELRVTVVATGLGRPQAQVAPAPAPTATRAVGVRGEGVARPVRRPFAVSSDYSKLEVPAIERLKAAAGDGLVHSAEPVEDILDIPAFLRRQAD
jgi:cell division protein FtsZ